MSNNMLLPLVSLESLNMEDIEITSIDVKMFSNLKNLKSVYFKKYRYCVFAATVPRCRPLSDGVSSFSQLIVKPVLRYSLWIIAMMTCVGNMLVIWGRFVFRDENKVLSVIIRNLAASDLLMGLYLSIIAFHDLKFRDIYHEEAHLWMSSWTCTTAGILAMISSEVSVLVLVFMSIDRFLLIASPFGRYSSLTVKETHVILTCIWFIGGGLAVIPALWLATSTWFYGINGLCLPLYIDDPFMVGWKVSAIIFFGINAIGLLIVIVVYIGMFLSIWKTRKASALPIREFEFALRFLFIVLTDASCRLPIIVAKAIAFLEIEISSDIYSWLVVFVLPINSALNPFLYTFTTPKYRSHVRKAGLQVCLQEVKKNLSQHPLPESYGDTGSLPVSNKSGQSISLKCISVKQ